MSHNSKYNYNISPPLLCYSPSPFPIFLTISPIPPSHSLSPSRPSFLSFSLAHPPLQPVIIDSTVTRDNKLNITWSNNATDTRPVDWYILEITTQPQGELSDSRARQTSREMTMTVNTTNIYHVTEDDYSRNIQYQFRIKAVNTAGESEFSNPFSHIHEPVVGGVSGKLPSWGIALIVVLSVLICCACCLVFGCCILCCCYRRRQKKVYRAEERGEQR